MWWKPRGHMTSQYGAYALRAGWARLYARMRMHKPMRPGARTHARTRKHAHKPICNTLLFHTNIGFVNAPQCHFVRTLPVLFKIGLAKAELFHADRYRSSRKIMQALCREKRTFCRKKFSTGLEPWASNWKVRNVYHCTPLSKNPSMRFSGKWEPSSE